MGSDARDFERHHGGVKTDRSSEPSLSSSSSDGASSDEESRRRDRKRRKMKEKEKKGHHRKHKSEKEKSSKDDRKKSRDEKKRKRRKRHADSESDSDSEDAEDRKKRRLLKEAKRLLRKHKSEGNNGALVPATSGLKWECYGMWSIPPTNILLLKVDKISEEDYFEKSNELAMWLKEAKGVFFSSLSSEETHKEFAKFVEVWNAGQLTPKYYQGIKSAPRTAHKWGIKLNHDEALALGRDEEDRILEKKMEKLERKKFHKAQDAVIDELLPKATGREALLEKKALRREQARNREDSPEIMKERDVMGGGDDFQQRLARERAWKEKKAAEKASVYDAKRSAFEEKEAAAMNQFRAMVNVAGGKISIPKRNDAPP
ncbi:hypothetical protein CY35_11G117900 [Sphagnum magellanicum]|nr:hypothetical protein CY35_11G117900 [Sphagnum magellanicum]